MIIGIGIDLVECGRFLDWSAFKKQRIFTKKELEYAENDNANSEKHLANFWAAREAFLKAIGTGFGDTMLVCALGIGVVFIGLAIIIGLVYLMNFITDKIFSGKKAKKAESVPVVTTQSTEIPNREELVAAIIAAVAEEEGKDISAIRVLSIKKV